MLMPLSRLIQARLWSLWVGGISKLASGIVSSKCQMSQRHVATPQCAGRCYGYVHNWLLTAWERAERQMIGSTADHPSAAVLAEILQRSNPKRNLRLSTVTANSSNLPISITSHHLEHGCSHTSVARFKYVIARSRMWRVRPKTRRADQRPNAILEFD
ncbi:hypothetical protein AUEXF2481DRAFT_415017 [Aureobasidium subglaciale EXF-2481]|uniref:Secreted protein n=1 Tax=Aureobasidium subglaciale (strain EXF-2481) TaxID=1043005 RepID=A0A074Z0T5_AURSE|nr:uncharacterized protein AUEXF2481DRAFT_415017 [Aureobasidium subglaciale EXF-2481]KEQ92696.1 hypothetical protein AUEXF2481DRAFT_415017 [Aureobasidium subglaciale EXF-2481]